MMVRVASRCLAGSPRHADSQHILEPGPNVLTVEAPGETYTNTTTAPIAPRGAMER